MERRNFIKTAGAILVSTPLLGSLAQAQSSISAAEEATIAKAAHPGPNPSNDTQLDVHPGWVRSGRDDAPGHKAYYINLEAKPGKGEKVEQFLKDILAGVEKEPGTGPWFGCRFSETTFGIFEAFPNTTARNSHDVGPGGRNFLRSAELEEMLAYPAHLYRLDVLFGKFGVMFGKAITS